MNAVRTLIVEDNEVNRTYLSEVLGDYGETVAAETAEEGLRLFRQGIEADDPFDLIFMDIMLPGMSGLQAIEQIRAEEQSLGAAPPDQVKIVVVSALDDDLSAKRAFFQGRAVSYLTKPLRMGQVREEMTRLGF